MKKFSTKVGSVHFVGIGGIGMSGIADILINLGYKVSGSDLRSNLLISKLERKGALISIGHKSANVHGASVVVVSSAVLSDNPEILEARRLKIPVVKRAEMLAELMKMKFSIAVAGTHGKTTTTSMIAALLDQASLDPTVINGGVINAYNSNSRLGSGDWIVVEADESDGSFTRLISTIAVVTNINFDHKNNFKNFEELSGMFRYFVESIPFYGVAILCWDHPEVQKIAKQIIDRKIITYGLDREADVSCSNVKLSTSGAIFDVIFSQNIVQKYNLQSQVWKNFSQSMYGEHNVQNVLAAISVGLELNISEDIMRIAVGSFMGVKRRFTCVGSVNGASIIDDYAHHPVEIRAVLRAARVSCEGKIFAIIQPHRHTRLESFLHEFADALELGDYVFVAPIYSAGEQNNGVDHFTLLEKIQENAVVKSEFVADVQSLAKKIVDQVTAGDFIVFLGAGDITNWAHELANICSGNLKLG
ncbi:MAG: UDP-N-acetylmuramate--L-alanine ligase [Holosporaceae bacterium]|nr:UDP-N-acetylmuramate--L-alanine ligase [Holosporaceae bacterium]